MKHPVDTSQWGEFVVGELFDVHPTKAYKLKNSELLTPNGKNPVIVNSSYNNGIGGYTDQELTESGKILTFSDTTSGADTLFFQEKPFVGYPHVQGMYPKTFQLKTNIAKFMIASLRASINKYSWNYTNKLTRTFIASTTIKLPLKSSADLSNYDSTDIDWNYMETVMSRVTTRAKERLASLPQPTDKKKTPVNTSSWGEFVVGELFDCDTTKTFYPNKSELPPGNTPYITRSTYDNGISGYYDDIDNEFTIEGNCLTIGAEGGIAFWQPKPFIAGVKVYTIRHPQLNELTALFIASLLNANSANYSYTNARVLAKIKAESIPLPLKPSADLSNYDQTDIDWNYMENFMKAIETKAQTRLKYLQKTIA